MTAKIIEFKPKNKQDEQQVFDKEKSDSVSGDINFPTLSFEEKKKRTEEERKKKNELVLKAYKIK
jgi:hypothetical protein